MLAWQWRFKRRKRKLGSTSLSKQRKSSNKRIKCSHFPTHEHMEIKHKQIYTDTYILWSFFFFLTNKCTSVQHGFCKWNKVWQSPKWLRIINLLQRYVTAFNSLESVVPKVLSDNHMGLWWTSRLLEIYLFVELLIMWSWWKLLATNLVKTLILYWMESFKSYFDTLIW